MRKYNLLCLICLSLIFFYSCNKSNDDSSVVLKADVFIRYSINGTPYSFTEPASNFAFIGNGSNIILINGKESSNPNNFSHIEFSTAGIALNSLQKLNTFSCTQILQASIPTPIFLTITEYGAIGEFISGNFTGTFIESTTPYTSYTITCSFRVRRN